MHLHDIRRIEYILKYIFESVEPMKKRLCAVFLCICFFGGLFPTATVAKTDFETVYLPIAFGGGLRGVGVSVETENNSDGTVTTVKKTDGGKVTYNEITVTRGNEILSSESAYSSYGDGYFAEGGKTVSTAKSGENIAVGIVKNGKAVGNVSVSGCKPSTETGLDKKEDNSSDYDRTSTVLSSCRTVTATSALTTAVETLKKDEDGNTVFPEEEEGYVYYVVGYSDIDNVDNGGYPVSDKLFYWRIVKKGTSEVVTDVVEYLKNNGGGNGPYYSGTYNMTLGKNGDEGLIGGLYCVDWSSETKNGVGYCLVSLSGAAKEGYYSSEQASHLRAIMKNGYDWSYGSDEEIPGTKSLAKFKETLSSALERNADIGFTLADIEKLSRTDAAAITQAALWSYANRIRRAEDEEVEIYILNDSKGAEAINAAYTAMARYLASLTDEDDPTTVPYFEENFIDDAEIIVGSAVEGETDVYNVSLRFTLKTSPKENDDLVLRVIDGDKVLKVARISGDDTSTEYGYVKTETSDGKTVYLLDGLALRANTDLTFDLRLTGSQYLEDGFYVFRSRDCDNGKSGSQNLIGRFCGYNEVDVSATVSLNFGVAEGTVTTVREWRREEEVPPQTSDSFGIFALSCVCLFSVFGVSVFSFVKKKR